MDEFGETPSIYVWPENHEEGQPFPKDFRYQVREALRDANIDFEWA